MQQRRQWPHAERDSESHWARWHHDYGDPASALALRLKVVQARLSEVVENLAPGPVRLASVCAGQGQDVVGALAGHPRSHEILGLLVEQDPFNASVARRSLSENAALSALEVVEGDASVSDIYANVTPVDVLLLCGIFGNVSDDDVYNTIRNASRICAPGAYVLWTRHRRPPDLTTLIRKWFGECGYKEVSFDSPTDQMFAVGVNRLVVEPLPFLERLRLFTFVDQL